MNCKALLSLSLSLVLASIAIAQDQETKEKPWFDLENCAICKNLGAQQGLMDAMKWDIHKLDNGMLMVSVIPDEMKPKMEKAEKGIQETVAQLESGKQLPMCGFCECYGKLMMDGATIKEMKGKLGSITMITSDDPEVVKQIHEMAERTEKEYESWTKAKTQNTSKQLK